MKKSFQLVSFFLFIFIFKFSVFAIEPPEGIKIYQSGKDYRIEFTLPQYNLNSISADGEEFYNLLVKGYGVTPEAGLPALPLVSFNLFISDGENNPSFEIINQNKSEELLDHKIFPQQMPWEKIKPLDERPFYINRDYYASRGTEFPLVKISEPFIIGGIKGVMVTIYPFNYNPLDNKISVTTSSVIDIKLSEAPNTSLVKSKDYNSFLNNVFVNYNPLTEKMSMKYLIITAPQFESGLATFISHKESFGCNVDVFNTSATGTTTTAIRNFIQQRYNDPQTRPEFVLLVGDVQHIPSWIGSGEGTPNTDRNYVYLEGSDYYSDAFIGRFSVTNTTELQNAVSKSIYMETNIATLAKKNIFMASSDNYTISEGTHNYVIDTWFGPAGYTNLKLYTHTYGATTQQLINALNDNQVFAIYSGHGGETSWADGPVLSQSQVSSLTNTIYPFVYSFACVTGSYHIAECFGETWLRTPHGGATFYGSSVNSYWDEDDILERRLIDAMFGDDLTRVTPMFDMAKIYLANHYGSITPTVLRYFEMYNLMGDPSMLTVRQIPPDTTPPDQVTDLAAANPESNRLGLTWTAPYDSTFGGVTSYDIRYSIAMINNDDDFNNAPQKIFGGQSDSAGTPKSFLLTGLNFNTQYYLAVKALDMWGNKSVMSNVVQGLTLAAPSCLITPDSMHCTVFPNTSGTEIITIVNNSVQNSTLDYSIELTNNTFPDNVRVVIKPTFSSEKGTIKNSKEIISEHFGLSIKGSGGPDLFGYEWIDSDAPNGPQYLWEDISATGTTVTSWTATGTYDPKDEGYAGPFQLGFNFKFYGIPKTQVYAGSNGTILFNPVSQNIFTNTSIPNSGVPNEFIAPFWDDLDGSDQGTVYYKQDGNRFIIQYSNWQKYAASTSSLTFQVVLYSSGKIVVYYNNMNATLTSATVGIENADGSIGLQVASDAAYVHNNLALQFSAEPDWLAATPLTGTIYSGNSADINLLMNTEGLELGDYSMDMEITTTDPNNLHIVVPITMTVSNDVPVELISFSAVNNNNEVTLKWRTSTETNNRGFKIERSLKGGNVWSEVGFVEGNGTTTESRDYSYKDKITGTGTYVYRLKQIDFDGTFNFSSLVEVKPSVPVEYALYQNYPNPFNPSTIIKFSVPEQTDVKINVYNTLGELVKTLINEQKDAGYYEVQFDASGLASGIYYYRIDAKNYSSIKKMLMIK